MLESYLEGSERDDGDVPACSKREYRMEDGMENEKELIELRKEFIGKRVTLDFDEVDDLRFGFL